MSAVMRLESDHEQDNALLAYLPVEMTQFPDFVFDVLLRVVTTLVPTSAIRHQEGRQTGVDRKSVV